MKPEIWLPFSQEPATSPSNEPAKYSPHLSPYYPHIYSNIILPRTPRSSTVSSFQLLQPKLCASLVSSMHITCPTHLIPLDFHHPNNISWSIQLIKFLIMQYSPSSSHFFSHTPKYSLSTLFSNILNSMSSLSAQDQVNCIQNDLS